MIRSRVRVQVQVQVQAAKQGCFEWAALSEPNSVAQRTLAVATLTIDLMDSKELSYKD